MAESPQDTRIRQEAFAWLTEQTELHGDVLPWSALAHGFHSQGQQIRLVSQQGIFKPQALRLPLSIRTAASGPYGDSFSGDLLLYKYRGTDPNHRDNEGLHQAMLERVPLVYFHGIAKGKYVAACPVFIVHANPVDLTLSVAVDDAAVIGAGLADRIGEPTPVDNPQDEGGEPVVPNGLALCKLHHAAFDRHFVGIRPDYEVVVRQDIREESDGPMLLHGLQGVHGQRIQLPRAPEWKPDPERLARRYERFRAAG